MTYIKTILFAVFLSLPFCVISAQDTTKVDDITVTGVLYDAENGSTLPFATINNGKYSSTFSEPDGTFSIKIKSANDILTINLVGYVEKDVPLAGKKNISIYLVPTNRTTFQSQFNTGLYSEKLLYSSHAVSNKLSADNSLKSAATTAENVVKGNISGLQVIQRNGAPGSGSEMNIRGFSSLNATNRPLIIVDGMIFDTEVYGTPLINGFSPNPLNNIDVNDIDNITVVKDAISVYGAKAANGVIYIQTKRAREQATKIDFTAYAGSVSSPSTIPMMDAVAYRIYLNDAIQATGKSISYYGLDSYFNDNTSYSEYYRFHNNTDWQKEVFGNGYTYNSNLSIQGGDDIILLAASVGYSKHEGNIKNTDFSRFSIRLNGDITISKVLFVNASFSFVNNQRNMRSGSSLFDNDDPLYMALIKSPFTYPYERNETGIVSPNLEDYDLLNVSNPTALVNNMDQKSKNYRLFGSFDFNLKLNEKLTISNMVGISFDKNFETVFVPKLGVVPVELNLGLGINRAANRNLRHTAYNNDFRIHYKNSFGFNNLNLLGGIRMNYNKNEEDWVRDYNTANDQMRTVGNGVLLYAQNGGLIGNWSDLAYYGIFQYDFNKKYFLDLSGALNGSSRFGKEAEGMDIFGTKFGFFPSAAIGWLASSEPFLAGISQLDLLKFRVSYGITGNDDIGNYASKKSYSSDRFLGYPGLLIGNLWNPKLKWETNKKLNLGMDVALFKERVSLSVDYYKNETEDMLFFRPVDAVTGFLYYTENNGNFSTKGIDLTANARILNSPVKWDIGLSVSTYKTEVTSVYSGSMITNVLGANILTKNGEPLGVFYGYKTNGVYATQQEAENEGLKAMMPNLTTIPFGAGDVRFVDNVTDGIIQESDMQVIGDPNPDFTGELNSRLKYKAFTLEAALMFSYGNDVFNYLRYRLESMSGAENQTQAAMNRWRYEGQVTDIPKVSPGDPLGNSRFSDRWIEDGSFARLRYVTLSYQIPAKIKFIKNSEVFVTGTNLLTLTKYKGLDPEFSYSGYALARGIDPGLVPQSSAFYLGFRVGL